MDQPHQLNATNFHLHGSHVSPGGISDNVLETLRLAERIRTAEDRIDAARKKALVDVPALAETLARDIADKLAPKPAPAAPRQRVAGEA